MCIMVKKNPRDVESWLSEVQTATGVVQDDPASWMGHRLAMAGDGLAAKFTKPRNEENELWSKIQCYALFVAIRLVFGFI